MFSTHLCLVLPSPGALYNRLHCILIFILVQISKYLFIYYDFTFYAVYGTVCSEDLEFLYAIFCVIVVS